ncbi:cyclic nucleotide-binding domain-containing protein [Candidatus Dependentiae bacterium]|nr:cyclic nucleotide-binding domain-containing protein [Candidatus Dependentiae bacterium]
MNSYNSKKIVFLKNNSIFKNTNEKKLHDLSVLFEEINFQHDEIIFSEGDLGDCMYLIGEGKILIKSENFIIAERSEGECIGEMSIIDMAPRSASAIATSNVKTLKLTIDKFYQLLSVEPLTGLNLFHILSAKIREDISIQKQIIKELNNANLELKRFDELKENILSNISHELRTPLTIIRGYNELLLKKDSSNLNETQKNQLKRSLLCVENLNFVIGNLIELSRLKTGNFNLNIGILDINKKIEEILISFKDKIELKNLSVDFIKSDEKIIIKCDNLKLSFVINNLIDNAIKFNKENGNITIKTSIKNNNFNFKISDTGIGMSETDKKKIFEIFFQKDNSTKRKYGGTGAGLSICSEIIRLHKGEINIESVIESGTIVSFYMPLSAKN